MKENGCDNESFPLQLIYEWFIPMYIVTGYMQMKSKPYSVESEN